MKVSVSMWSLQSDFYKNKIDTAGFIELSSQWGVDGVELLDFFFKNEAEVNEIIRLLEQKKLLVAAFSIENDFAVESSEELEGQIAYVKESIDMAVRLKTHTLRILSGYEKNDTSFEKGLENIITSLKACVPYAEEKGVIMVLENHGRFSGTSVKMRNIIEQVASEYLKVNVDTGNFLLQCENPVDGVYNLKEMIGFLHIKDLKKLDSPNGNEIFTSSDFQLFKGTSIGKGDVDMLQIINILRTQGYNGYLSVEYEGSGNCITETEESLTFLKALLVNK